MRLRSLCPLLVMALVAPVHAEPLEVSSDEDWSAPRERTRRRYYGRAERELEAALLDREAEQASFDREQVEFGRDRRQLVRTLRAQRDALEAKQEEEARRTALVSDGTTDAELKRLEGRVREALDAPETAAEEPPPAQPAPAPTREDQRRAAEAAEAQAREEAEQRALDEAAEKTLKAAESREQRARQEAARKLGGKLDASGQFVDPDLARP